MTIPTSRRMPGLRGLGRRLTARGGTDGEKAEEAEGERKAGSAVLPVMKPDEAGIDIGATEMFVAVPGDRDSEPVR